MTPAEMCQAWQDLLKSQYPGQIYNLFIREQAALTQHLIRCITCSPRLRFLSPLNLLTDDQLKNMDQAGFDTTIRKVRKNWRATKPHP